MGKANILNHFQHYLLDGIQNIIENEWDMEERLIITDEKNAISGQFYGYIDISISNRHENPINNLVAIEIEHISNFDQAKQNIDKMKTWTNRSKYRRCSVLHIFNETGIGKDEDLICALIEYGKKLELKNKHSKFFYDFCFFDLKNPENKIEEHKIAKKCAEDICKSYEFKIRLWQLLIQVGLAVN
ncbi:MAG: hypothetical protein FWC41_04845 [Firmicutes bacterium]|nr:hypothetical protein [Bacillota bacterium]